MDTSQMHEHAMNANQNNNLKVHMQSQMHEHARNANQNDNSDAHKRKANA